ncbi:hypothetical protein D3C77_661110 [compost metagenome]
MFKATLAVVLAAPRKVTLLEAMKALMSATLPSSVRLPVPEPLTDTPLPDSALSLPLATDNSSDTGDCPASISAIEMPVTAPGMSSVTLITGTAVMSGASLTA